MMGKVSQKKGSTKDDYSLKKGEVLRMIIHYFQSSLHLHPKLNNPYMGGDLLRLALGMHSNVSPTYLKIVAKIENI